MGKASSLPPQHACIFSRFSRFLSFFPSPLTYIWDVNSICWPKEGDTVASNTDGFNPPSLTECEHHHPLPAPPLSLFPKPESSHFICIDNFKGTLNGDMLMRNVSVLSFYPFSIPPLFARLFRRSLASSSPFPHNSATPEL